MLSTHNVRPEAPDFSDDDHDDMPVLPPPPSLDTSKVALPGMTKEVKTEEPADDTLEPESALDAAARHARKMSVCTSNNPIYTFIYS